MSVIVANGVLDFDPYRCIWCHNCGEVCPVETIIFRHVSIDVGYGFTEGEYYIGFENHTCIACGGCAEACPTEAIRFIGDSDEPSAGGGGGNPDPGDTGGGGSGSNPGNNDPKDPCKFGKVGADKTTNLSASSAYTNSKAAIMNAIGDGKEHVISLGLDANNNILASEMTTGSGSSGTAPNIDRKIADLHNHPNNKPPSSGDLYSLIEGASNKPTFDTRIVFTNDGSTIYAYVIADLDMAKKFIVDYPKVNVPGGEPAFPNNLQDEYTEIIETQKGWYGKTNQQANETAISYMLNQYKTGVVLLKLNQDGVFKPLNTKKSDSPTNNNPFTTTPCPN